MYSYL